MNYIDLFSGIGGFALGAYWAGVRFDNHFFSDIEKYPVELYKKRFPDAIPLGDINKIDTKELKEKYGDNWVLTGGFPCQDISIAGKGAGIHGERSGLWFGYWRLIRELRPRVAIMENVGALTYRGLDAVLGTLSEIGYNAEWQDIRAEDVGAPHRRERIWIVSYPASNATRRNWRGLLGQPGRKSEDACRYTNTEIPNTDSIGYFHGQVEIKPAKAGEHAQCNTSSKSYDDGESWRSPQTWATEPTVGRLAYGIPCRVDRLKGLGNSIVPQIAMIVWEQIKKAGVM